MSTPTSATRPSPPASKRASPAPSPSISRGATARSAATPRVSSPLHTTSARRASLKAASQPVVNGETREALSASLKSETEHKEQLLVQVQDRDQTIVTLNAENATLTSSLNAAETRVNELYEDQARSEVELANRIDISDKLRSQLRELEKEKRELQRRYNEQTSTFDAERQALYDNEQHLKSRIQSLTQSRKQQARREPSALEPESDAEGEQEEEVDEQPIKPAESTEGDLDSEPAEMTALRLELSTLATSYSSLQSTVGHIQSQLVDLKRVNNELQEENESYMILLRERTLNGQFDPLRQMGGGDSSTGDEEDEEYNDVGSLRSISGRSTLDRVEEEEDIQPGTLEDELERSLDLHESRSRQPSKQGRARGMSSASPTGASRGESLADLPITGPGLDLAAELGRAENKDILEGSNVEEQDRSILNPRGAKRTAKKLSTDPSATLEPTSTSDLDALRSEVKALKDANKALSLYASKIIDRIIAEEGFEHVLAADYEKQPMTPIASSNTPTSVTSKPFSSFTSNSSETANTTKQRPQSVIVGPHSASVDLTGSRSSLSTLSTTGVHKQTSPPRATHKAQRRSLSFDWKSFSLFSGEKKPDTSSNLRPLTLKPGTNSLTGNARKLETEEDDEDRKERERLHATMKLMGIQPQPSPTPPAQMIRTQSTPAASPVSPASPPTTTVTRRFSLFGRSNSVSTTSPEPVGGTAGLTEEALVQAEAENSLAALDAHERSLSIELAKGSSGSFTEIKPRSSRRGRRSGEGSRSGSGRSGRSGSTVFSAGIEEE